MKVKFFKQELINLKYRDPFLHKVADLFDGSTQLVNGKWTAAFERDFASYLGADDFIFVSNGLDALILALEACDLHPDDEVIVPCHTYIASWLAPLRLGFKVVAAPVRHNDFLLDIEKLPNYITKSTKVVMPVHLYGNSCDIDHLKELQKAHDFKIIEDAAQAHGTYCGDSLVGNTGDITCFSFYPTKNLGSIGEAGGLSMHDPAVSEKFLA